MSDRLYKFLSADGSPTHGRIDFRWPMPNGKPGAWAQVEGPLVECENGLHLIKKAGLLDWLNATLYGAEYEGEHIRKSGDRHVIVCRKARLMHRVETWNERTARLFACDCAERVLPIFEGRYPGDVRPRYCIETARAFGNGEATREELAAAWAAAWAAARTAAGAAARDAAGATAWAAAWAAARATAGAAAWAAERKWQQERLIEYLEGKACGE